MGWEEGRTGEVSSSNSSKGFGRVGKEESWGKGANHSSSTSGYLEVGVDFGEFDRMEDGIEAFDIDLGLVLFWDASSNERGDGRT